MNIFPQGITNNFQNNQLNFSYAHAALQPLCFLDTTKNLFSFMESNGMRYNNFFPINLTIWIKVDKFLEKPSLPKLTHKYKI